MVLVLIQRAFPRQKSSRLNGATRHSALKILAVMLWILVLCGIPFGMTAHAIQNTATGTVGGSSLLVTNATVTLTRVGNDVTSAVSEITPNMIAANSTGNAFIYSILPVINAGDGGLDQVVIAIPGGYSAVTVTQAAVNGASFSPAASCPPAGPNQYCVSGGTLTVRLPGPVLATTVNKRITVNFTASAPSAPGNTIFSSTVDNSSTAHAPLAAIAGNADADAANANNTTVTVLLILPSDLNTTVTATPQIVIADGTAASTITTLLRDTANQPVSWKTISLSSDRGADVFTQPASPSDSAGAATGTVRSNTAGVSTITSTDVTDTIVFSAKPQVFFTQGNVLELIKAANKKEAVVGEVVTYLVELKNKTTRDVILVKVDDHVPPNFKYLKGSTLINGVRTPDPAGNRTVTFDIGTVPALVDTNNNHSADKGEAGYMTISYQLVIGSGATPKDYVNTAQAKDVCDACSISNADKATVTVVLDPLFDLGTIIGKVFEDKNKNGWQDPDEPGISSVMVALDNGTYALTDEYGRYHLPAIKPGQRLVKINLQGLPNGAVTTTDEARVVDVTPGLLAKANFGVTYAYDVEKIGKPAEMGVEVTSAEKKSPLKLIGNTEALTMLMNGEKLPLHSSEVHLQVEGLDDIITTKGKKLGRDIEFLADVAAPDAVKTWTLTIFNFSDEVVKTLQGSGAPPTSITWNGMTEKGQIIQGGEVYQYQMEIEYLDGTGSASTRRTFGVNNVSIISVRLTGSAFKTGSTTLNEKAKEILKQAAIVFREYPDEKIIIEGHSDAKGTDKLNRELSRKRAQAAADYLVQEEKLEPGRFNIQGYGKTKPIASNKTEEGREQNRRVEVQGEVKEVENSKLRDYYRTEPSISINGESLRVGSQGRFSATLQEPLSEKLDISLVNSRGRSIKTSLAVPSFEIIEPKGEIQLPFGKTGKGNRVFSASDKEKVMVYRLVGKTGPGNTIELDGELLSVSAEGGFTAELKLKVGRNNYGLVVRNAEGVTRLAELIIDVKDADEYGQPIMVSKPIPNISVKFPPAGARLTSETLIVSGITDAGNTVEINGARVKTDAEGQFSTSLKLPLGKSTVIVKSVDLEGNVGTLARELEVTDNKIFLLAFADGKIGQLVGKGNLEEAGMDKQREYYTEGRVAYYLKGTIKGKYIITSAFDTGTHTFGEMFNNLDSTENDRLLTNLDPDKLYPVYGDSGTVVNDVQSQGKLYLAIDSDELHVIVGNYALNLGDTELASYRRTLYGGRVAYQSVSRTQYGRPDTTVMLFGAEVRQAHIQDELRATGGSLYYLSHKDIIEGSEQISLIIRDKTTGLTLENVPQKQNIDYTIKYEEGRVLFNRPILQSVEGSSLVSLNAAQGNPVIIRVDYETRLAAFDKKADGGRVRKQIGDHVAVGMSYVKDELLDANYELKGVDSEIRLGKNTRITMEYAESIGVASRTFTSDDGGLAYQQITPLGARQGHAWKTTVETDVGEWVDRPDRLFLGGYLKKLEPGFMSNGNAFEEGTEKLGFNAKLRMTEADTLLYRFESEKQNSSLTTTAGSSTFDTNTIQAQHHEKQWSAEGEYKSAASDYGLNPGNHASYGAGRYRYKVTEKLTASIERQETITGTRNDQTTAGVDYQIVPSLTIKVSETQATAGDSAQAGMVYNANNNRLYVTERLADDQAGNNTTSTIVGGETPIGPSSKLYSEYQWNRADGAARDVSLIGALRNWDAGNGLKFMLSGEQSVIDSNADRTKRYSLASGILYSSKTGLKVSTRNEIRRDYGTNEMVQYLTVNNLEYKLNTDLTVIGKYRYSLSKDLRNNTIIAGFDEACAGLAYRPVAHDWFNALAKYTSLSQQNASSLAPTQEVKTKTDVFSVEWSAELSRYVEWVEKEAARIKTEKTEDRDPMTTHTYLSIHRLNFHLWKPVDLGIEYRVLWQKEAQDQREGFVTEISWKMVKYLRFGVGYNFTDFSDNEFSDNNYSVHGWFVRLQSLY
ncbi:MAG: OmpA family protein [Nitrospirae bacterium]|nr:OmpA family protein [Nitrospirota bacterium]